MVQVLTMLILYQRETQGSAVAPAGQAGSERGAGTGQEGNEILDCGASVVPGCCKYFPAESAGKFKNPKPTARSDEGPALPYRNSLDKVVTKLKSCLVEWDEMRSRAAKALEAKELASKELEVVSGRLEEVTAELQDSVAQVIS
ncbi:unnamed protein product [Caretta caretta]